MRQRAGAQAGALIFGRRGRGAAACRRPGKPGPSDVIPERYVNIAGSFGSANGKAAGVARAAAPIRSDGAVPTRDPAAQAIHTARQNGGKRPGVSCRPDIGITVNYCMARVRPQRLPH